MFFWNYLAFLMIQQMLVIWSLVPLPFLKPAAFAVLLGPPIAALAVLIGARCSYPRPGELETSPAPAGSLPRTFRVYVAAVGLIAAGYADFPLIAFGCDYFSTTLHLPAG